MASQQRWRDATNIYCVIVKLAILKSNNVKQLAISYRLAFGTLNWSLQSKYSTALIITNYSADSETGYTLNISIYWFEKHSHTGWRDKKSCLLLILFLIRAMRARHHKYIYIYIYCVIVTLAILKRSNVKQLAITTSIWGLGRGLLGTFSRGIASLKVRTLMC